MQMQVTVYRKQNIDAIFITVAFCCCWEPVKEMMPTPGKMMPTTGYIDTEFRSLSEILNAWKKYLYRREGKGRRNSFGGKIY